MVCAIRTSACAFLQLASMSHMPSTYPPNNLLEWPPSPSGSHAELMTVMPSPPGTKNPVQPSVTRVGRFDAECGHGVVTVGSQEGWVAMMQKRCAELGSDSWVMRERALKAEEKVKQMKKEIQEMSRVMRTIRTSLHETELQCVAKDRALNSAQKSIDMLEQENNELKKDAVRTSRLLAWYRSKKNQEASLKQVTARVECDTRKHGISPSRRTVATTTVCKRREKEKADTNMAARSQERRVSRTSSTQDGSIVAAIPVEIGIRTTEAAIQTFMVDKEHVEESQ